MLTQSMPSTLLFHQFLKRFCQTLLGRATLRIFGFLTFPLVTFYLLPAEMGLFQLLCSGFGLAIELFTCGLRSQYDILFFQRQTARLTLIGQNLWVYKRITAIFFLLSVIITSFFLKTVYVIALYALFSYVKIYNELFLNNLRFQFRFFHYNTVCMVCGLCQTVFIIVNFTLLQGGLLGFVFAFLLAELITFSYVYHQSKRSRRLIQNLKTSKLQWQSIAKLIKNALFFIPSTLSFWLQTNIDQWMLGSLASLSSVGCYSVALKFSNLFEYVINASILAIYTPILYSLLKTDFHQGKRVNQRMVTTILALSVPIFLCIFRWNFLFHSIIGKNYTHALIFIAPLITATLFRLSTALFNLVFFFQGHVRFSIFNTLFAVLINVVLNYTLIPKYGIYGCVAATNASFVSSLIVANWKHWRC